MPLMGLEAQLRDHMGPPFSTNGFGAAPVTKEGPERLSARQVTSLWCETVWALMSGARRGALGAEQEPLDLPMCHYNHADVYSYMYGETVRLSILV